MDPLPPQPSPYGMTMPVDLSTHGGAGDLLTGLLHVFMLLLFVGWGIFFVYCLVKFRKREGGKAQYDPIKAKASKNIEIAVAVIEVFLLFVIATPAWNAYKTPPSADKNPLEIRVVAQQFAWNVHYPGKDGVFGSFRPDLVNESTNPIGLDPADPVGTDDVVMINQMYVPKGRTVSVRITSKDVIHSFFIPVLRVKQDAIPGIGATVSFEATGTGDYEIACAQLCGLAHYKMRGEIHIQTPEEFEKWYASAGVEEEFSEEEEMQ